MLFLQGCGGSEGTPAGIAATPVPKPVPVAKALVPKAESKPALNTKRAVADPTANADDLFRIAEESEIPADPRDQFFIVPEEDSDPEEVSVILGTEEITSDAFHVLSWGQSGEPRHNMLPGFKLPVGFEVVKDSGHNADGLPWRIRCTRDGSEMVLVPQGPGILGSNVGPENARPELKTELKPFYMDETEVTVGRYLSFLDAVKKDDDLRVRIQNLDPKLPKEHPVTGISWGDAILYCRWSGKSLPSESQWEKAARGETGFSHPWGHDDPVWFPRRDPKQITTVMSSPTDKSPYGVFDLASNAREWCADWYHADAFVSLQTTSPLADWAGPKTSDADYTRVVKGNGQDWKLWHREGVIMRAEDSTIGFRGVLTVSNPNPSKTAANTPERD